MEIFKLTHTFNVEEDGKVNVCLRPENETIRDFIATYRSYENQESATSSLSSYIQEMTPLLYSDFKAMENIDEELRNSFSLE